MCEALEIMMSSRNANHANNKASVMAVRIDQDWKREMTVFTFDDGSVLIIRGPQMNAYESYDSLVEDMETFGDTW